MVSYNPYVSFDNPISDKFSNQMFDFELGESYSCSKLKYRFNNKSDSDIEINWNKASFIVDGEAFRIFEGAMRGSDSNMEQLPQLIPSKTFKQGSIVSGKNLGFNSTVGWTAECFLDSKDKDLKGKTFKMRLPINIEGESRTQEFDLIISDVVKKQSNILLE